MGECKMCPRRCGADRENGKRGYCGESAGIRVARTSLHMWEEPCITGEHGSGTVFFSGCALKCIFCQNRTIAGSTVGKELTLEELADAFLRLQDKGAANINLVTAGHFADRLIPVIGLAKNKGLKIPLVYNSSGYETVETLKKLDGLVDIYLPDCKFYSKEIAGAYANAPDYFDITKDAIKEMVRQAGWPQFEENTGIMKKGVIVRHLVLPGHTKDSESIIQYLFETYGNKIYISIMNQYTPMDTWTKFPNLNRRITKREYERVVDFAISIGVQNAFIQEGETADESFIPKFDEGIL